MKKIAVIIIGIVVLCGLSIVVSRGNVSDLGKWGKNLSDTAKESKTTGEYAVVKEGALADKRVKFEDIVESGKDALITNDSVEIATKFYTSKGMTKKRARVEAIKYVEAEQALYVTAIAKGYDVTDEEIDEYVSNLKDTVYNADNKEDMYKVINEFDSENDFWDYQRVVAKTDLPIINYTKELEEQYRKAHVNDDDVDAGWNEEFENIKAKLVRNQDFKEVKSSKDIEKKWLISRE